MSAFWTTKELSTLQRCVREGMSVKACCAHLPKRTPRAIRAQALRQGWRAKKLFSREKPSVALRVTAGVYEKLAREARLQGIGPGRLANTLLEQALGRHQVERARAGMESPGSGASKSLPSGRY